MDSSSQRCTMTTTPILEAQEASLIYTTSRGPIAAVENTNLRIEQGECVAILGRSGSGKSTLLALLGGLCKPTTGEVLFHGKNWGTMTSAEVNAARTSGIGLLLQEGGLLPGLRVLDNVLLSAVLAGMNHSDAVGRATELLKLVGLGDRWDAYPADLSGGQKRRVALARALAGNPRVILADEPTGDLDLLAGGEIVGILKGIRDARRTAIVVVTHDPAVAAIADKRFRIEAGRCTPIAGEPGPAIEIAAACVDPSVAVFEPTPATLEARQPSTAIGNLILNWMAVLSVFLFAAGAVSIVDNLIAGRQEATVQATKALRRMAEEMALQDLRADLDDVVKAPDGTVIATMFLQNYHPDRTIHVLGPAIEVGIQWKGRWDGIPNVVDHDAKTIRAIGREKTLLGIRFKIPEGGFDELLPGYIHVRIGAAMVVSDQANGTGDLFDRQDAYYIYLRDPHRTDDWIRRANRWSEKATIPMWISMPSH